MKLDKTWSIHKIVTNLHNQLHQIKIKKTLIVIVIKNNNSNKVYN